MKTKRKTQKKKLDPMRDVLDPNLFRHAAMLLTSPQLSELGVAQCRQKLREATGKWLEAKPFC
jgi:hypothetical protein